MRCIYLLCYFTTYSACSVYLLFLLLAPGCLFVSLCVWFPHGLRGVSIVFYFFGEKIIAYVKSFFPASSLLLCCVCTFSVFFHFFFFPGFKDWCSFLGSLLLVLLFKNRKNDFPFIVKKGWYNFVVLYSFIFLHPCFIYDYICSDFLIFCVLMVRASCTFLKIGWCHFFFCFFEGPFLEKNWTSNS